MGRVSGSYIKKEYKVAIRSSKWCFYCQSHTEDVHIEHIYPLKLGGDSSKENLTGSCYRCNGYKSDFPMEVFLQRIIDKRDKCINKLYSYTGRYRRYKNRNPNHSELVWLLESILKSRKEHSYFTSIINSITTKKYIFNGRAY